MIKLIATDMDGTWLNDHQDYDHDLFAQEFKLMQEKGIVFVVASGNQHENLLSRFPKHADNIYFVAENGALIAKGKEVLHTSPLDQRSFEDIKQITAKYEYPSIVEGISSAYVRKSDRSNFLNEMYKYYAKIKTINNFNEVSEPVFKVNMSVPVEKTLSIIDDLQKQYPEIKFTAGSADSIDMQPADMNKAKGLEYLSKMLNINPSEMVAFGDSGNDVEMLKYVGKGYVMSTGMEVVKDAADQIIGKNNDSAVQKEILKLLN